MSVNTKIRTGRIAVFFVLMTVLQMACHRRAIPKAPVTMPSVPEPEEVLAPSMTISNPYIVVSLQKTPCFGSCPVFEARVFSNGTAIWEGERHTARIGKYEATVPHEWLNELMAEAEAIDFFRMAVRYPLYGSALPDVPQTITFMQNGGKQRRVTDNAAAPVDLVRFEKMLEEKLNTLEWKPKP